MSVDPGSAPAQGALDLGPRTQADYDFIAASIARFEGHVEAERLRQAAKEPYRPSGMFGAFTESDLAAAIAAALEHGELRVFLVHVIEFGGRASHTTAGAILRAKAGRNSDAPCSRHTYQRANRKLRAAGIIEIVQRGAGRAALVRRPQPRLAGLESSARALSAPAELPARALSAPELRVDHEKPSGDGQRPPARSPISPPPWQSQTLCGCGRAPLSFKPGQESIAEGMRVLDPVCRLCHQEHVGAAGKPSGPRPQDLPPNSAQAARDEQLRQYLASGEVER